VFVRNGYHSAAMDDIAERAGVSKPVVYQHFPGKLELYLALLDRSADALIATVREALGSTSDNGRRVEATTAAYFDYIAHDAGTFRLIFESDLIGEPAVRERVDRVNQACAEAIKDVIAEDTRLGREAAMLLAAGLTGTAVAAARWWLTSPGSIDRADAERLVSALSWRGISNVPRAGDPAG
jgi:AcrR family transcriptional regulator